MVQNLGHPKLSTLETTQALGKVGLAALRRPFTSDGCTNWPDGPWYECCVLHDLAYVYGPQWGMLRRRADRELCDCVTSKGYPVVAQIMYRGVRAFGWIYWNRRIKELKKDGKVG